MLLQPSSLESRSPGLSPSSGCYLAQAYALPCAPGLMCAMTLHARSPSNCALAALAARSHSLPSSAPVPIMPATLRANLLHIPMTEFLNSIYFALSQRQYASRTSRLQLSRSPLA
jgi:hypothetical protein